MFQPYLSLEISVFVLLTGALVMICYVDLSMDQAMLIAT